MPVGEIAFELFGAILRFLAYLLGELIFYTLVRGLGYFVLKTVRPNKEPGRYSSAFLGLGIWLLVIWGGWSAYQSLGHGGT